MKITLSRVISNTKAVTKMKIAEFIADDYKVTTVIQQGMDHSTIDFLANVDGGWFAKDTIEKVGTAKVIGDFVLECL